MRVHGLTIIGSDINYWVQCAWDIDFSSAYNSAGFFWGVGGLKGDWSGLKTSRYALSSCGGNSNSHLKPLGKQVL